MHIFYLPLLASSSEIVTDPNAQIRIGAPVPTLWVTKIYKERVVTQPLSLLSLSLSADQHTNVTLHTYTENENLACVRACTWSTWTRIQRVCSYGEDDWI